MDAAPAGLAGAFDVSLLSTALPSAQPDAGGATLAEVLEEQQRVRLAASCLAARAAATSHADAMTALSEAASAVAASQAAYSAVAELDAYRAHVAAVCKLGDGADQLAALSAQAEKKHAAADAGAERLRDARGRVRAAVEARTAVEVSAAVTSKTLDGLTERAEAEAALPTLVAASADAYEALAKAQRARADLQAAVEKEAASRREEEGVEPPAPADAPALALAALKALKSLDALTVTALNAASLSAAVLNGGARACPGWTLPVVAPNKQAATAATQPAAAPLSGAADKLAGQPNTPGGPTFGAALRRSMNNHDEQGLLQESLALLQESSAPSPAAAAPSVPSFYDSPAQPAQSFVFQGAPAPPPGSIPKPRFFGGYVPAPAKPFGAPARVQGGSTPGASPPLFGAAPAAASADGATNAFLADFGQPAAGFTSFGIAAPAASPASPFGFPIPFSASAASAPSPFGVPNPFAAAAPPVPNYPFGSAPATSAFRFGAGPANTLGAAPPAADFGAGPFVGGWDGLSRKTLSRKTLSRKTSWDVHPGGEKRDVAPPFAFPAGQSPPITPPLTNNGFSIYSPVGCF